MLEKEFNENILNKLTSIDQKLLSTSEIVTIVDSMKELKKDISELKYTLLNPENGVIVKTNKNTEAAYDLADRVEEIEDKYYRVDELINFKNTVTKALWILFSALVGIVVKLVSMS